MKRRFSIILLMTIGITLVACIPETNSPQIPVEFRQDQPGIEVVSVQEDSESSGEFRAYLRLLIPDHKLTDMQLAENLSFSVIDQEIQLQKVGRISGAMKEILRVDVLTTEPGIVQYDPTIVDEDTHLYVWTELGLQERAFSEVEESGDNRTLGGRGGSMQMDTSNRLRDFLGGVNDYIENQIPDVSPRLIVLALRGEGDYPQPEIARLVNLLNATPNTYLAVISIQSENQIANGFKTKCGRSGTKKILFVTNKSELEFLREELVFAKKTILDNLYAIDFEFTKIVDWSKSDYDLCAKYSALYYQTETAFKFACKISDLKQNRVDEEIASITEGCCMDLLQLTDVLRALDGFSRQMGVETPIESGRGILIPELERIGDSAMSLEELEAGSLLIAEFKNSYALSEVWVSNYERNAIYRKMYIQEQQGLSKSELLETYNVILKVNPEDHEVKYKKLILQAEMAESSGRNAKALRHYSEANNLQPSGSVEAKMRSLVISLVKEESKSGHHEEAFRLAKSYERLIGDHFETRFYWAESAMQSFEYEAALQLYQWLSDNWKSDNNLLAWADLIAKQLSMHIAAGQYQGGYELIREMHLVESWESPISLDLAVYLLRGNYLVDLLEGIGSFYSATPQAADRLAYQMKLSHVPSYLDAIFLTDNNGNVKKVLYREPKGIDHTGFDYSYSFDQEALTEENIFIGRRLPFGSVVAQINYRYLEEGILINEAVDELRATPTSLGNWTRLESHIWEGMRYPILMLATALIGTEYLVTAGSGFDSARNFANSVPWIDYIVVYNVTGNVQVNQGFEGFAGALDSAYLSDSSRAQLMRKREYTYGGKAMTDFAYPFYSPAGREGVVRIGIVEGKVTEENSDNLGEATSSESEASVGF